MATITGCTLNYILPSDNPNEGRVKINNNFNNICNTLSLSISGVASAHTVVLGGENIEAISGSSLGVTQYTINLLDDISINDLSASGDTYLNSLTASTLSGGTIFSGNTDLYDIFAPAGTTGLTFSDTLSNGNTTSGNNIIISNDDDILLDDNSGGSGPSRIQWNTNHYIQYDDQGEGILELVGNNGVITTAGSGSVNINTSGLFTVRKNASDYGQIRLSNNTAIRGDLRTSGLTSNQVWHLPDNTGTIALVSDIAASTGETTASNGLTKTGNNITLGGTLTGDTYIDNSGNLLRSDTFSADTMSAQTIHVSNLSGFSPINVGNNLETNTGVTINAKDGGGQLDLRVYGTDSEVMLSNDNSGYANAGLYLATPSGGYNSELFDYNNGFKLNGSLAGIDINTSFIDGISLRSGKAAAQRIFLGHLNYRLDFTDDGMNIGYAGNSQIVSYTNIGVSHTTLNSDNFSLSIASRSSTINANVLNSVILGGQNITATTNNAIYTQNARLAENGGVIYSGGTDLYDIFGTSGTDLTTASNGLTKSGYNITLGGALTGDTFIDNSGFLFRSDEFSANTISAQTIHVGTLSGFSPINLDSTMVVNNNSEFQFNGGNVTIGWNDSIIDAVVFSSGDDGFLFGASGTGGTDGGYGVQVDNNNLRLTSPSSSPSISFNSNTWSGSGGIKLIASAQTSISANEVFLPDASGTIALISDISASTGETTASNGLIKTGNNITLGGTLTGDTDIQMHGTGATDTFSISNSSGSTNFFLINGAGDVYTPKGAAANLIMGENAARNYVGAGSTVLGYDTGTNLSGAGTNPLGAAGGANVLIGASTSREIIDGRENTILGVLAANSSDYSSISSVGYYNFRNTLNLEYSYALGNDIARLVTGVTNSSFIGYRAGYFNTSSGVPNNIDGSILIGNNTRVFGTDAVNQIIIGNNTEGLGDNTVVIGNTGVTDSYIHGSLRVDTMSATTITGTTVHVEDMLTMVPYTDSNPHSSPSDNDVWFNSGATGTITLNYRVGGATKSVELA